MPANIFLTSYMYFMIITFSSIHVPRYLSQDYEQYMNSCGRLFNCGSNLDINYPFWGGNRPSYCGRPEFQLSCLAGDDAPWLTINSTKYRVFSIDYIYQTIRVAREEFWTNNFCPKHIYNATLDSTTFYYGGSTQNATLFYGCTKVSNQTQKIHNQFECTVKGTTSVGYYTTDDLVSPVNDTNYLGTCNNSLIIQVTQVAAKGLSSNPPLTTISKAIAQGFELEWALDDSESVTTDGYTTCDQCSNSGGGCGYNSSSSSFTCFCSDGPYPSSCTIESTNTNNGSKPTVGSAKNNTGLKLAIGFSVGVAGIVLISIVTICSLRRGYLLCSPLNFRKKRRTMKDENVEAFIRNYGSLAPNGYKYSDIKRMTNSFREKLGQGGYGSVYKGNLSDGRLVAVKILSETQGGNGEEFINEVASISRTSHVNVVTLLGFCYQGPKRALVYEFMPNGSLDKFIHNVGSLNTNPHLECKTLFQIAVGIAQGLEYLHRGCNTRIVHFDIKPHNILLDEDFCPKIADFGLAKLCQRKESIVSMMGARGTAGYIAPEVFCRNFGGVSYKSDVYSYGMMVLEMTGAKDNVKVGSDRVSETYFPDWIYEHLENGKDLLLSAAVSNEEEEEIARKMILVSLWCIQTNPSDRPSMSKVVEMLEGSLQSLQIPPKPYLFSTIQPIVDNSTSLSEVLTTEELSVEQI